MQSDGTKFAKDVADILEYSLTEKMTIRLDEDEKAYPPIWWICRIYRPLVMSKT
ncbi:MAG: hypothetical protein HQK63_17465 [Desulfamplus sp.]|nr:hypothetical protein [Desulfamplus sp.]